MSFHSWLSTHLSCLRMHFQSISLACLVLFCQNVASIFFLRGEWQRQMLAFCLLYMLCEATMSKSLHCGLLSLKCELYVCQCTAVFCDRRRLAQVFIHVFSGNIKAALSLYTRNSITSTVPLVCQTSCFRYVW